MTMSDTEKCKYPSDAKVRKEFMFRDEQSILARMINSDTGHVLYMLLWCHLVTLVTFTIINWLFDANKMQVDTELIQHQLVNIHYTLAIWIAMHLLIFILIYPLVNVTSLHVTSLLMSSIIIIIGLLLAPVYFIFTFQLSQVTSFFLSISQLTLVSKVISYLVEKVRIQHNTLKQIVKTQRATTAAYDKNNCTDVTCYTNTPKIKIELQSYPCTSAGVYHTQLSPCINESSEIGNNSDIGYFLPSSSPLLPLARDGKSDSFYISEGSFESLTYDNDETPGLECADKIRSRDKSSSLSGKSELSSTKRNPYSINNNSTDTSVAKLQLMKMTRACTTNINCTQVKDRKATGIFESLDTNPTPIAVDTVKLESFTSCNKSYDVNTVIFTPEHEDENTSNRGFHHFVYFIFAPTLIYSQFYPHNNHPRKWRRIFLYFSELIILLIICSHLINRYYLSWAATIGKHAYSFDEYIWQYYKLYYLCIIIYILLGYAFFHSFLNGLSELLLFADRRFYQNWWAPDQPLFQSFDSYFEIINSWIQRYIYQSLYKITTSSVFSSTCTTLFSLCIVETIIFISFKLFIPIISLCTIIVKVFNYFISPSSTVKCFIINTFTMYFLTFCLYMFTLEFYSRVNCPPVNRENNDVSNYFTISLIKCIKVKLSDESVSTRIW